MTFTSSPTELTTAATDAVLAVLSVVLLAALVRTPSPKRWRTWIWASVFGLLAAGSTLGAVAHGLDLPESTVTTVFRPLYLTLALSVALFFTGAIGDWLGERAVRAVLPWAIAAGLGFFVLTQVSDGGFKVFIEYEAVAMVAALLVYAFLWLARGFPGAGRMTLGIALTLAAAGVQVSALSARIIWPFDHNGLFHLVQIAAVLVIASGLRPGMRLSSSATVREQPQGGGVST